MKESFKHINFQSGTLSLIETCNSIIENYQSQGYDLTLRQLYYQLVSQDLIPNNQKEYNKLGVTINNARLCGLIDWEAIVDRTRNLMGLYTYENPEEIIRDMALDYRIDKWEGQEYRVEVWIEKDALAGVFQRVCNRNQIDFFSCRGYTSQSEMYSAGKRLAKYRDNGQTPMILHFGDHDPSGIDMSRDIRDRLEMFNYGDSIEVDRLALNMEQVRKHNPPPNFAKLSDSRAGGYIRNFGKNSWELDALNPETLASLVDEQVKQLRDEQLWEAKVAEEKRDKEILHDIKDNLDDIKEFLREKGLDEEQ